MNHDSTIIGEPDRQLCYWEHQGQADNCAVVSEMSIINQFGYELTQDEANFISASHGWYHPGGGTAPDDIGQMMDMYNIPNHTCTNASVADLARELQAGHGVIVGVNSAELWESGPLSDLKGFLCKLCGLDASEFNPADHAVVVTGIDASDPENPMVIINDSGHPEGGGEAYPLDQFMDAWENSDFYYTATDSAIPFNDSQTIDNVDFSKWFAAGAAAGLVMSAGGDPGTALEAGLASAALVEEFFATPGAIDMV